MDDFDEIREKISESASSKKEEKRLLEMFETAVEGLEKKMKSGVKSEVGGRLKGLYQEFEEKADVVREKIRE